MKKLYLITKTFPLGAEEKAFLQYEAELLQEKFDLTIVTTQKYVPDEKRSTVGYKVLETTGETNALDKVKNAFRFLCKREAREELADIVNRREFVLKRWLRAWMFGTAAETFWEQFVDITGLRRDEDAILYFYWWDYKCLGATSHKNQYPKLRIVARTHGYDLYHERELYGKQFFKKQMERCLDRLYFISEYGMKYYEQQYGPDDRNRRYLYRLGVKRRMEAACMDLSTSAKLKTDPFLMVSCSNVIPIKRIHLIIEGLAKITDANVKWIHFGDGSMLDEMKNLASERLGDKSNIAYEFAGRVDNKAVMDFYAKGVVDCFITTTSTEGNPVSVQEALSFGIPIIGTTVSDIPCMIQGNGVLLPENPTAEEDAEAIRKLALCSAEEQRCMREISYKIWERDYDGDTNYHQFVDNLLEV